MIKQFQFQFEELNIKSSSLEELMGYEPDRSPFPFPELYGEALAIAPQLCEIRGGYRILENIELNFENKIVVIDGQTFSPGKVVFTQLQKATSVALYTFTVGKGISDRSKKLMDEGDLMLGYILDVIGSVTVEKASDKMQGLLNADMQKNGLNISDRYSPGYCDWSVSEQQQLFSFFPKEFCGITLGKSSLMNPIKSVSGIIGIGKDLKMKGYQCEWCPDENCIYGRIKRKRK